MVGLSFVHGPQDIYDLHKELTKRNCADLGIVAKIETSDSVHNLARTLIAGLDLPRFAVLIARGDLAVEVGFENLAFKKISSVYVKLRMSLLSWPHKY